MQADAPRGLNPASFWVVLICWLTLLVDGYDLIVYGAVLPTLLEYQEWALTPAQAGAIGSYTLLGGFFGALIVGVVSDAIGRKKTVVFCVVWFSIAMGLCAIAPSPELFGVFRFLAGIGLGGLFPTAGALTVEYAPPGRRNITYTLMATGFSTGGILSAVLAIWIVPALGFRAMFWIGVLPLFIVVPLAVRFMPESISFLLSKGRRSEAEALARRYGMALAPQADEGRSLQAPTRGGRLGSLTSLFSGGYLLSTLLFLVACFFGQLLIYGLNTWLPSLMREAGYSLGSSLGFLLVLNLGAIFGMISAALIADRIGSKLVCTVAFVTGAVSITLLSTVSGPLLLVYLLVALAGLGTVGAQTLVNAYIAGHYPPSVRATALGSGAGFGRLGAVSGPLIGGLVLGSGLGLAWNFYAFALAGVIGALVVFLVPPSPVSQPPAETLGEAGEAGATPVA